MRGAANGETLRRRNDIGRLGRVAHRPRRPKTCLAPGWANYGHRRRRPVERPRGPTDLVAIISLPTLPAATHAKHLVYPERAANRR